MKKKKNRKNRTQYKLVSYFSSLGLSFSVYKMGIIILFLGYC